MSRNYSEIGGSEGKRRRRFENTEFMLIKLHISTLYTHGQCPYLLPQQKHLIGYKVYATRSSITTVYMPLNSPLRSKVTPPGFLVVMRHTVTQEDQPEICKQT